MKNTRRYGLYAGLIFSAALMLLSLKKPEQMDMYITTYSFFACFPFLIFFILLAMLGRRKELGNHIDFNEGFKAGLGVSAIAGLIYGMGSYLYFKLINHELVVYIAQEYRKQLLQHNKNIEEFGDRIVTNISNGPFSYATIRLVGVIFVGGIISIILALIVRRKHIEVLTETE